MKVASTVLTEKQKKELKKVLQKTEGSVILCQLFTDRIYDDVRLTFTYIPPEFTILIKSACSATAKIIKCEEAKPCQTT